MRCCRRPPTTTKTVCAASSCRCHRDVVTGVISKYCKGHTCSYFYSPPPPGGTRCNNRKEVSDSLCLIHCSCPIVGCRKAKIQHRCIGDETKFTRAKFCNDHECCADGCQEQRTCLDPIQPNKYRPYCRNHVCKHDKCIEKILPGSQFCKKHKCEEYGCQLQRVGSSVFCQTHNQCEAPDGCNRPKERGEKLCTIHLQCEADGCVDKKVGDTPYCSKHTCQERNCLMSSDGFKYCKKHRCEYEGCGEHRRLGTARFCALHSCQKNNCRNQREDTGLFCTNHTCEHCGCCNEKEFRNLCEFHYREECRIEATAQWSEEQRRLKSNLERERVTNQATIAELIKRDREIQQLLQRPHAPLPS
ncbi:hypothetical protein M426DRAFT_222525 [Hypoxylon sp. CI-4A]|nr:hypothetical protein M426DRAFT_222525 [Hypoxylon sp. CI-4A]